MKFKIIAVVVVVVVMLLATIVYLATKNSGNAEGEGQQIEQVQP